MPSGLIGAANSLLDRFVVGAVLGPGILGFYTAAYTMTAMPRSILSRTLNNLAIPVFVNEGGSEARGNPAFDYFAIASISVGFLASVGVLCLMRPVLLLVYGAKFLPSAVLTAMIAADLILKLVTCLGVTPSLALGHTRAVLRYTLLASPALAVAALFLIVGRTLESFLAGMLVGDVASVLIIVALALHRYPYTARLVWTLLGCGLLFFAVPATVICRWPGLDAFGPATIGLHMAVGFASVMAYAVVLYFAAGPARLKAVLELNVRVQAGEAAV